MPIANWEQDYMRLWEEATGQPAEADPGPRPKPDQIKAADVSLFQIWHVVLDITIQGLCSTWETTPNSEAGHCGHVGRDRCPQCAVEQGYTGVLFTDVQPKP